MGIVIKAEFICLQSLMELIFRSHICLSSNYTEARRLRDLKPWNDHDVQPLTLK